MWGSIDLLVYYGMVLLILEHVFFSLYIMFNCVGFHFQSLLVYMCNFFSTHAHNKLLEWTLILSDKHFFFFCETRRRCNSFLIGLVYFSDKVVLLVVIDLCPSWKLNYKPWIKASNVKSLIPITLIKWLLNNWQVYQFVLSSKVKTQVQVSNPRGLCLYLGR